MKSRAIHRILEGIFLFTLILMIYALSIFSAKGQMARELSVPFELTSNINELSSVEEKIIRNSLNMSKATSSFHDFRRDNETQFVPDYIINSNDPEKAKIEFPRSDFRRRELNEFYAPFLKIPIN